MNGCTSNGKNKRGVFLHYQQNAAAALATVDDTTSTCNEGGLRDIRFFK